LSDFNLSHTEQAKVKEKVHTLFNQLTEYLNKKNELALLRQELDNIKTEYQHFQNNYKDNSDFEFKKNITAADLLLLWLYFENQAKKGRKFGFIKRLIFRIKYGIKDKSFYSQSFEKIIMIFQSKYYLVKISELIEKESLLETSLKMFSFDEKMKEYTKLSMQLLKAALYKKYEHKNREPYTINELRSKSSEFIKDYPVIMSVQHTL